MIRAYIQAAMEKAKYEIIDDPESYYGSVPGLKGVWATGKTLEACRRNLEDVIDSWIAIRLQRKLPIPPIKGVKIRSFDRMPVNA